MGSPIVPNPDTGPPTQLTSAQVAALTGSISASSSILGYTDNSVHSINALVELVYVRIGNEVMAQSLSKLEGAISATKQALDALSTVQGLQNMISVKSKSAIPFTFSAANQTVTYTKVSILGTTSSLTFIPAGVTTTTILTFPFSETVGTPALVTDTILTLTATTVATIVVNNNASNYMSAYNLVASAYYKPIDPFFSISVPPANATDPVPSAVAITATTSAQLTGAQLTAFNWYKGQLLSSRGILSGLISALGPLTPTLPNGNQDPTTLLAKLKIVYQNMPSTNTSFSGFKNWVLDGYATHNSTSVANQGLIQQQITNAIVAGESLNSSQNASVRRYMFIFEQYYQSATSIISALNQSMLNIARKVSGGNT